MANENLTTEEIVGGSVTRLMAYPHTSVFRELCIATLSDTEVEIRVIGLDGKTRTCKLTVE